MMYWRSVEDALPPQEMNVLVRYNNGQYEVVPFVWKRYAMESAFFDDRGFYVSDDDACRGVTHVTHWTHIEDPK